MKKRIKIISLFLICCTLFNCQSENKEAGHLVTFDVASTGESIIFSWKRDNKTSVYKCDMNGKNVKKILDNDSLSFFAPRYNKSGDSLSFIATDYPNSLSTSLGIYSIKKEESKIVLNDSSLKTEVIFSDNGNKLYFLKANEYDKYSSIGRKAPHGFDIYEFGIKDTLVKPITNFNAYQMSHLNYLKNDILIFSSFMSDTDGVFLYNCKKKELNNIKIENDTLKWLNGFSAAEYINDETLLSTSYYEVILVNLKKNRIKRIYRSISGNHIGSLRYSRVRNKLFVSEQKQNTIQMLDLNGNLIKTIQLNIN